MEENPFEDNYEFNELMSRLEDFFENNKEYNAYFVMSKIDQDLGDGRATAYLQNYDFTASEDQKVTMIRHSIETDSELRVLSQDRYIFVN